MDSFKETVLSASAKADTQLSTNEIVGMLCALLYEDLKPVGNNSFSGSFGDYTFGWEYRNNKIEYTLWYCGSSKRPSLILSGKCSIFSTEWLKKQVHSTIERNENEV